MPAYASFATYHTQYKQSWEAYVLGAQWARKGNAKLPKTFKVAHGEILATGSQLEAIDFRKGWTDFGKGRNPNAAPTCAL